MKRREFITLLGGAARRSPMTMSTMTSSFASLEAPATMQRNRSVLAPEVRIALERHMGRDHWR
jgi:hypothetical protein